MEESYGTEEPPAVMGKGEPKADNIASQPNIEPDYPALLVQGHELAAATSLIFPALVEMTNPAQASVTSSPPMATVSLADLHSKRIARP